MKNYVKKDLKTTNMQLEEMDLTIAKNGDQTKCARLSNIKHARDKASHE